MSLRCGVATSQLRRFTNRMAANLLERMRAMSCARLCGKGARMTDARSLTSELGGRWHARYGTAPCPVCQPERRRTQNALTVRDGRGDLLLHCKRSGCEFRDVLAAVGLRPGDCRPPDPATLARSDVERLAEVERKARAARALWREAEPIGRTIAEGYLRSRGIACPLPPTLRFHGACWHGPTGRRLPALVALVEGGGGFAVHRTWLRADGGGKADIDPTKAMLGAVTGGAVRLAEGPDRLAVGEGIESAGDWRIGRHPARPAKKSFAEGRR